MSNPTPGLPILGIPPLAHLRLVEPAVPLAHTPSAVVGSIRQSWARRYQSRLRITDSAVILVAVAAALLARFGVATPVAFDAVPAVYWATSVLIAALWIATLGAFHTRDSRVVGVGATEYKQVVNGSAVAFGLLAIAFLVFQIESAREYFALALPLGVGALTLERWLWRKWLFRQRRFDHYLSRVIVVGERDDVEYVVSQIESKSGAAYHVIGAALGQATEATIGAGPRAVPVVSDLAHIADAVVRLGADAVVVAGIPIGGSQFIRTLGWELEGTSAELVLSSRLTDVAGPRIHFRPVEGLPLIHVEIPRFDGLKHSLKRTLDIVASGLGLLVLLPFLIVLGILIRCDSPGPALFRQERCGRNQRLFWMLKFRSMVQTAETDLAGLRERNEGTGLLFKIRDDPRVTRLGRTLRKYSLDELPQLWNVFIGDMSLVGPRPPLPNEVDGYESHVHRRLYIKPGLTGMWQVNGRSDLDWDESVRLDLYYVENWSLTGDLIILWRTVRVLVNSTGAY